LGKGAVLTTLTDFDNQDGKSYIQMAAANVAEEDTRNQGYALVARTVFASKEDMDFYDNECEAHGAIKALIKPKVVGGPPLVVYMDVKSEEVF
jgi:hypothetical protein